MPHRWLGSVLFCGRDIDNGEDQGGTLTGQPAHHLQTAHARGHGQRLHYANVPRHVSLKALKHNAMAISVFHYDDVQRGMGCKSNLREPITPSPHRVGSIIGLREEPPSVGLTAVGFRFFDQKPHLC